MKTLMILLATIATTMTAVQAENVHPAVDDVKVMEANTTAVTQGDANTTEVSPEEK